MPFVIFVGKRKNIMFLLKLARVHDAEVLDLALLAEDLRVALVVVVQR